MRRVVFPSLLAVALGGTPAVAADPAVVRAGPGPAVVWVDPQDFPQALTAHWEAADADPPEGVAALDGLPWRPADPLNDDGPRGAVRWFRLRLDLTACRGLPVMVGARGIRDVDETYLDGVRIGGRGSFPPDLDPANIAPRHYPLPTDIVNAPGPHVLAIRVYHGPRSGPVLSSALYLERLAFTQDRWWVDQVLAGLAGLGLGLFTLFVLFYRHQRETVFLVLAAFVVLIVSLLLTGHYLWNFLPGPRNVPFRLATVSGALLCPTYFLAVFHLIQRPVPPRFRLYLAAFGVLAVLSAVTTNLEWLVRYDRALRALALIGLVEAIPPTYRSLFDGRRLAAIILGGHAVLGFGVVWQALTTSNSRPWFYVTCSIVLALLGMGLYSAGVEQRERRLGAVLAERSRMAREVHDTLAQGLAGIAVQLESVDETLESAPQTARRHLERALRLARLSLAEARCSVWALRPHALAGVHLGEALQGVADELRAGSGVDVSVHVLGRPRPLPAHLEAHLFHIGREALANAVRHARPNRIRLEVRFTGEQVRLRVEDDGCGFDPSAASTAALAGHLGLVSMRERAEEIRGRIDIASRPAFGTRVEVEVAVT